MRLARSLMLAFVVVGWTAMAATPVPQFRDHEEYNLVGAIQLERDPGRRLVLLDRWAQRYPNSAFRQERWNQLITAYRSLGHPRKMRDVARRMVADDPVGFGNYWITALTVNLQDASPHALEEGRGAADTVLRTAPENFAAVNCPSTVPLAEWYKERDRQIRLAHRTLGWVALEQKQYPEAASELTKVVALNPSDAEACFWLGSALLGQQKPEFRSKALYYFARSLAITGKNALQPEARRLVQPYFARAYSALNGSDKGMTDFLQQAGADFRRE